MNLDLPLVICHRGASNDAPENTLAALKLAHLMGGQWVEFDVMLTADNVPIVIHDERLSRTTNGVGKVGAKTAAEIKQLDAGSWFSGDFFQETVPTFAEYITCAAALGLGMNIELKSQSKRSAHLLAERVSQALADHWRDTLPRPLISSSSEYNLRAMRESEMSYPLGLITHHWSRNLVKKLQDFNCVSLHIYHQNLTQERVALIKDAGYLVLAYTVNDVARAQELFSWGVSAVFSDYPKLLG